MKKTNGSNRCKEHHVKKGWALLVAEGCLLQDRDEPSGIVLYKTKRDAESSYLRYKEDKIVRVEITVREL